LLTTFTPMAETSGFFNAVKTGDVYDRTYLAEDFAGYFKNFIGNGIYGATLGGFNIGTNPTTQKVTIGAGKAFINGYWYENDSTVELSAPLPSVSTNYYSVFLRLDMTSRRISLVMSPATTSGYTNPTRNETIWDLRLWIVSATATQYQTNDRRGVTADCGYVTGLITQIDTTTYQNQLNAFVDDWTATAQTEISGKIGTFDTWIANQQATATADWNAFKTQAQALIDGGETSIQQQVTDFSAWIAQQKNSFTATIQDAIDKLDELIDSGDVGSLVERVQNVENLLTSINTALDGKMNKVSGTIGNNLAVGSGGQAVDAGAKSIDVGSTVGGILTGTMPNPWLATVAQQNVSSPVTADYGQTIALIGDVNVGSTGRVSGKTNRSVTLPNRPFMVYSTEDEAREASLNTDDYCEVLED